MNYTKKEREYYNKQRENTCKALGITKNQYNWLRRKGEELHKIYENNCNGVYDTEKQYYAETTPLELAISHKAQDLKLYVYYQTDPRGASLYLDTKEIPENNYTQAYCIY